MKEVFDDDDRKRCEAIMHRIEKGEPLRMSDWTALAELFPRLYEIAKQKQEAA